MNCAGPECERPAEVKGLCRGHRQQSRKGNELKPLSRKSLPFDKRFWSKVDKSGDCWVWTSGTTKHGYGMFCFQGRMKGAHVVSWEIENGPVPDGMKVDHRCHTEACVRPSHLRLLTHEGNGQYRKGAQANTSSGFRNVNWNTQKGMWQVKVQHGGKAIHGGFFEDPEVANLRAIELRKEVFKMEDYDKNRRGELNGALLG